MERRDIWELKITTADKKNTYSQLFTQRPKGQDEVLETSTVVDVRDMARHFGLPKGDDPMVCRIAGTYVGEIKVTRILLFENGDPDDND